MADFADRSFGIGYPGGAFILFALLFGSLALWYCVAGSVAIDTVRTPNVEAFYWVSILFSQTLGIALGDWMADTNDLGMNRAQWCLASAWWSLLRLTSSRALHDRRQVLNVFQANTTTSMTIASSMRRHETSSAVGWKMKHRLRPQEGRRRSTSSLANAYAAVLHPFAPEALAPFARTSEGEKRRQWHRSRQEHHGAGLIATPSLADCRRARCLS